MSGCGAIPGERRGRVRCVVSKRKAGPWIGEAVFQAGGIVGAPACEMAQMQVLAVSLRA